MAAVPIEIRATLYDLATKSARQVFLQGTAALSGVGVGGGPMPGGDGGLGIWGPTDPRPGYGDPGIPGNTPGRPPGIWGGPIDPYPGHPLPEPPGKPTEPPPDGGDKPPPADGGWGFVAEWSQWGYFPGPTEAQPKG